MTGERHHMDGHGGGQPRVGLAWIFTACAALLNSGNMSNGRSASEIDEVEEEFLDRLEEFESASDDPVYQAFFDAVVRSPLDSPERSFANCDFDVYNLTK